ncbi:replication factor A [Halosimplex pelagicum]|uniref:Replication factor A n=1 Tax=Halosimplex pelagicum TaxID=869886 RepID=A0A7D5P9I6_9EURY|nr:replication factor A [Halosimplex pelagicum]QLH82164.1 replication factor A [Halosimplex pelagicum]
MSELKYPDAVDGVKDVLETAEQEEDVEIGVDDEAISERLEEYVDARIDPEDAVRYVVEDILEDAGVENTSEYTRGVSGSRRGGSTDNEQLTAEEIVEPNRWIEFEGTVIETFDTSSDSIAQQGRLADDTGTIRFTIWESSDVETRLEEGKSYNLEPVVVNEFQGEFEIKLENVTDIAELKGDDALGIDPDEYTETVSGAIIKFQDQMGLIDRCPNEDCRRVLQQVNYCPDCGEVDSELDLRTKAVVDTGNDTWTIFLDEENTEALAHINLQEAKRMVEEHNDRSVVRWAIEEELHGEYLKLWGRDRGRRFDVEEFELAPSPKIDELQELQDELKGLP